ncbi:MAG: N-acetylmuramoyl-L-alanine amidase [Lentisphaeria bacterium]|nr:N-acetylmuramoyl-L-alanine amidase [Lentisphaeria bacterium]
MIRLRFFALFLIFSAVFFSFSTTEAAPQKTIQSIRYSGRKWVKVNDIANFYGMKVYIKDNTLMLYSRYYKAVFNTKSRAGSFNGVKLHWFFLPFQYKNAYYISEQDFLFLLDPLIRQRSLKGRPVRTIMIDAGHGGKDTGAIGVNKKKEKDITLAIALKLRRKLIKLGYTVWLTRAGDTFPSLDRRVALWKGARPKPDLFISIHCNAAANRTVRGMETFAVTPLNVPSTADKKPVKNAYPGQSFNKYNTLLAYSIQRSLIKNLPYSPDRGVKHARFYVIRNVSCPAVLIETGFVSNWAECTRLSSDVYQDKVATAILRGIINYSARVKK